jgi:hypothetical protein
MAESKDTRARIYQHRGAYFVEGYPKPCDHGSGDT